MSSILYSIILTIITLVLILYYYLGRNFNFWKNRNVKGPDPVAFFGNHKNCILGKIHSTELSKKYYDKYNKEPMVGIHVKDSPVLILRDLDLIKDVLIKDFSTFSDRGICIHDNIEPLSQHFFNLPQSSWRSLKNQLSPAFTISKIKNMFIPMMNIADRFKVYVEEEAEKSDALECCSLIAKVTTEIIGEYGFGIKMNQFTEEINEFKSISNKRSKCDLFNFFRRFLREYVPLIYKYCYFFKYYDNKKNEYYINTMREIGRYRKSCNTKKRDYADILIDLKDNPEKIVNLELTDTVIAAQAYVFFTAGSDTVAIIISNAFYELAVNQSIQNKLRDEINEKLLLNADGKLTFDDIKSMNYLDKVYHETLRKYPLRDIIRKSNASYTFSGTNVTIPKNTKIIIPHFAIHHDSNIYPRPEIFDPERFDESTKKSRHRMAYLPFGAGPRSCIGERFADVLAKVVIVNIIQNFKLTISNSIGRNKNNPRKVLLCPEGGIKLHFARI